MKVGLADGQFTEILEGALEAGATVVTNVSSAAQPTRTNTNMFVPGGFAPGGARQGGRAIGG